MSKFFFCKKTKTKYNSSKTPLKPGNNPQQPPVNPIDDKQSNEINDNNNNNNNENDELEPVSIFQVDREILRAVAIMSVSQFIITAGFGVIIPVLPTFANELGMLIIFFFLVIL